MFLGDRRTNEARKIRQMLRAVRSQLRSDLSELTEDVLRQQWGTGREASHDSTEMRGCDVSQLRTELALRTLASRYALLRRIDEALEPSGQPACGVPQVAVAPSAAPHDAVAV